MSVEFKKKCIYANLYIYTYICIHTSMQLQILIALFYSHQILCPHWRRMAQNCTIAGLNKFSGRSFRIVSGRAKVAAQKTNSLTQTVGCCKSWPVKAWKHSWAASL